jgi:hypothetical protein
LFFFNDEAAVPSIYWKPREPRLNRQKLSSELKDGAEITGVTLSNPEPVLSVRVASWEQRGSRFISKAPANVLDEVRARLKPLLSL